MALRKVIGRSMAPQLHRWLSNFIQEKMGEFAEVHAQFPGEIQGGGISNLDAFWLYYMVKSLNPKHIIESGTLYGYSLYFMVKAACPDCEIHSFDIDQQHSYKFEGVQYHECDWLEYSPLVIYNDTLIFFDDHIDHGQRYREAVAKNIKHILFHDNYTHPCSHTSIRFYALPDANLSFIFPYLPLDNSVFTYKSRNSEKYRWLTYIRRGGASDG